MIEGDDRTCVLSCTITSTTTRHNNTQYQKIATFLVFIKKVQTKIHHTPHINNSNRPSMGDDYPSVQK